MGRSRRRVRDLQDIAERGRVVVEIRLELEERPAEGVEELVRAFHAGAIATWNGRRLAIADLRFSQTREGELEVHVDVQEILRPASLLEVCKRDGLLED